MRRDEIYRTRERVSDGGGKPGFYVVVSRNFIAEHDDVSTVICAPVYGEVFALPQRWYWDRRKEWSAPRRSVATFSR